MKRACIATLVALSGLTLGSIQATTIYDNLAVGDNGTLPIEESTFFTWANQFLTPNGSPMTLISVVARLTQGSGTGSISALLYSDSSNTPGSLIDTIATVGHASIPASVGPVTFTAGSLIILQPNTEYWIVLDGESLGVADAFWEDGVNNAGTGVGGQNHAQFNGAFWTVFPNDVNTNTIPLMSVDVDAAAAAAPEPATFGLMGVALAACAVIRRRTQRHLHTSR